MYAVPPVINQYRFRLNDAFPGDVVRGNSRRIYLNVEGGSCIDYIDIVKNRKCIARLSGPLLPEMPEGDMVRCKVKVDFGWNREEQYVHWQGKLSINKELSMLWNLASVAPLSLLRNRENLSLRQKLTVLCLLQVRMQSWICTVPKPQYHDSCHASCHSGCDYA